MSLYDPRLRVRLNEQARNKVRQTRSGKHNDRVDYDMGLTNLHIEKGLVFAQIDWGITGLDAPVSADVLQYVEAYEVDFSQLAFRDPGVYTLWTGGRNKKPRAQALVKKNSYSVQGDPRSEVRVSGTKREDVIELFNLMRDGKLRPDIEHGTLKQIEGGVAELNRLRKLVPELEQKLKRKTTEIGHLSQTLASVRGQLNNVQASIGKI